MQSTSDILHTNLCELIDKFTSAFSCYGPVGAVLQWQGKDSKVDEVWARAFITYDGVQIGRINFQPVAKGQWKVYGWKKYKPDDCPYTKDDAVFYTLNAWFDYGYLIDVESLVEEAKKRHEAKIAKIFAWRAEHPRNHSRKSVSKSWRGELLSLVREEYENAKDMYESLMEDDGVESC